MVNTMARKSGECKLPISHILVMMSCLIVAKQVKRSHSGGGGCDFCAFPR